MADRGYRFYFAAVCFGDLWPFGCVSVFGGGSKQEVIKNLGAQIQGELLARIVGCEGSKLATVGTLTSSNHSHKFDPSFSCFSFAFFLLFVFFILLFFLLSL